MGKLLIPFTYKELQIIKHALQHYTKRDNAVDVDVQQENKVLEKVTNKVNDFKFIINK